MTPITTKSIDELVKALPVWYKGWRFRSRTEGRWATFFERMGIEFHYEPQGFRLPDGATKYLPDFYLPVTRSWAEIKGCEPTREEKLKCELTVRGAQSGMCLVIAGPPDFRAYPGVSWDTGDITEAFYSLDIYGHGRKYYDKEHRFFSCPGHDQVSERGCSGEFRRAVYASRSARFDEARLPHLGHEPFNLSEREMGGE